MPIEVLGGEDLLILVFYFPLFGKKIPTREIKMFKIHKINDLGGFQLLEARTKKK
jgi:hypothetical protein